MLAWRQPEAHRPSIKDGYSLAKRRVGWLGASERVMMAAIACPLSALATSSLQLQTAPAAPAGGFTLIEILVAMTIFFMVIGILVSATAQAMRLADIERTEAVASRNNAMRLGWFRDTIAQTFIAPGQLSAPFKGSERAMAGITGQSLSGKFGGPGNYAWELAFNQQRGETELRPGGEAGGTAILSWAGATGRFRYLDESGEWRDQWPPFGLKTFKTDLPGYNLLPVAVMLEYGSERNVVVAGIVNRSMPPPSLKELLQ